MPEVSCELKVQVAGGPQISASQTLMVEAYDSIQVTVKAGTTGKEVDVQPGIAKGQVKLLLIRSNQYDPAKLLYKLGTAPGAKEVILDAPQLLIGSGAIGLLDPAPQKLFFSNTLNEDVSIHILVGRDATSPPPSSPSP